MKQILDIILDADLIRKTNYVPKGSKFGPHITSFKKAFDKNNFYINQIVMAFDIQDEKWKMGTITGITEFKIGDNLYRVALSKAHLNRNLFATKVQAAPTKIDEN